MSRLLLRFIVEELEHLTRNFTCGVGTITILFDSSTVHSEEQVKVQGTVAGQRRWPPLRVGTHGEESSPSTPASALNTSFRFHKTPLAGVRTLKYRVVTSSGDEVTYGRALDLLAETEEQPEFTQGLITTLRDVPFPAYFFETPPVTHHTIHSRPFEFVLVDAPVLARVITGADPTPFQEHLDRAREEQGEHGIATFSSLGRDATLVSPVQSTDAASSFTHLAQFTRYAPAEQVVKLWAATAVAMQRCLQEARRRPLWLSTSGLGVYWLHMRIDTRPKYYTFDEYKTFTESPRGGAT